MQEFDIPPSFSAPRVRRPRVFDDGALWASCIAIGIICLAMSVAAVTITWKASFGPLLVFVLVPFSLGVFCFPVFDYHRRRRFYLAMVEPNDELEHW